MENLGPYIEALIFAAENPIKLEEIKYALENTLDASIELDVVSEYVEAIQQKYLSEEFGIEIHEIAGGFQFLTKGAYHDAVGNYLKQITNKKLSRVAMETLAIIAYKQPVSKPELEKIRGVSCDYALQKLLDRELVSILGRSDSVGKPLVYGTSDKFMHYFGLKDLTDLPKLKEFAPPTSEIGEPAPIEEEVIEITGQSQYSDESE